MPVKQFLDTNILLYGYDLNAGIKRLISQQIIEDSWKKPLETAISVQVLQEFHVNFVRHGHSLEDSRELIGDLCRLQVVENSVEGFALGLSIQERWQLSFWDSMILAAAKMSGAQYLLSEDLNHEQDYGGVVVINPFAA